MATKPRYYSDLRPESAGADQTPIAIIASPRLIAGVAKAGGASEENVKAFLEQYPDHDQPREWKTP